MLPRASTVYSYVGMWVMYYVGGMSGIFSCKQTFKQLHGDLHNRDGWISPTYNVLLLYLSYADAMEKGYKFLVQD